ncbi:MAG: ADP-ribosylation factor-like protein, partial [Candidatus Hodarchaeota archaeon]
MSSPTLVIPSQQTIPVAIVGLPEAGKTAFVRRLCGESLGMLLRTVGIDAELYRQGELSFHLFDLGGGEAFQKVLWEHYIRIAEGIIFVVDGANPNSFPNAYKCFSNVIEWTKPGIPILLLWNKSDSPAFVPYFELSDEICFNISESKTLFPITVAQISALQDLEIKGAFDWLAQQIYENMMSKPAKIQALRVYSRHPEIILAQIG